jgi:hypothetical protein
MDPCSDLDPDLMDYWQCVSQTTWTDGGLADLANNLPQLKGSALEFPFTQLSIVPSSPICTG